MRKSWAAALSVLFASAIAAALAPGAGPARAEDAGTLNIYNWTDYIDPKTVERFNAETGIKVRYDVYDTNETLDAKLRAGHSGYDLVVPTASPFLANQIAAGLYRPLDRTKLKNYGNLDPVLMKQLANYDPGNRHAIPWMWGTTGLGYNVEKVAELMPEAPADSLACCSTRRSCRSSRIAASSLLDVADRRAPGGARLSRPRSRQPQRRGSGGGDPGPGQDPALCPQLALVEYINDLANGDACLAFGFSGDI